MLQLLLDSANPKDWEEWLPTGLFSGITTNPTLLRQARQPCTINHFKSLASFAEQLGCKELHLQAWGETKADLTKTALSLALLRTAKLNIHVKIPITLLGAKVAKTLIDKEISVTFTSCY